MLRVAAEDPSARVGAWNVRDLAGHLAATERDCYEPRIHAIAAGERPVFDYFTNEATDFGDVEVEDALEEWSATRARVIDFVKTLTEDQHRLTGRHEKYGDVRVEDYLAIALDHDRDHLNALERLAGRVAR